MEPTNKLRIVKRKVYTAISQDAEGYETGSWSLIEVLQQLYTNGIADEWRDVEVIDETKTP